jgi:hypothetical protein
MTPSEKCISVCQTLLTRTLRRKNGIKTKGYAPRLVGKKGRVFNLALTWRHRSARIFPAVANAREVAEAEPSAWSGRRLRGKSPWRGDRPGCPAASASATGTVGLRSVGTTLRRPGPQRVLAIPSHLVGGRWAPCLRCDRRNRSASPRASFLQRCAPVASGNEHIAQS